MNRLLCLVGSLAVALSLLVCRSAHGGIRVTISRDSGLIVIANADDEFRQKYRLVKFGELPMATNAEAKCETLGSDLIALARSRSREYEAILARYNLVSVWLGNICRGKTDRLPDVKELKRWLLDLATQPDPFNSYRKSAFYEAPDMLMQMYLFGAPEVEPDHPAAVAYLNDKDRNLLPRPEIYWAYMYSQGLGVTKDTQEAHARIKQIGPLNSDRRALVAQWHEIGDGEIKNEKQAFDEYLALAEKEHGPARFRLGVMYFDGRGTDKNACQAKYWLQLAAQNSRWPIPQAKPYLDRIESEGSCPQPMPERKSIAISRAIQPKPSMDTSNTKIAESTEPLIGARSQSDIDAIFERNRGAVFAVYSRALRDDKELRGKVEFKVSISAQGDVVDCVVVTSEIDNPDLLAKLIARQKLFKFPPIESGTQVVIRTWDFRPIP
jgi:TPR repeat protein